ncbi:extracellular solute-binding protein [Georgenia deserti]|uniref:Extracellular solute-binding protein n=1 Tax=Georgenia deserti TaxID=2093781 RepID=A0ABW4L9J1_9MICO
MTSTPRPRRLAAMIAAGTCAALLAACTGGTSVGENPSGANSGETVDGTGPVEGSVRLAYWGSGPRIERTQAVADLFLEEHPEVTIEHENADFAPYWERLNVQASSGNMPCLTQTQGRQLNDYTTRGALLPLQPMIDSGAIDVSDIPEDVLDTGRGLDGELYMIPYGAAYDAVVINETLAEEAGVGLPEEGYTWEEFGDYLREAQEGLPEDVKAANLGGGLPNYFIVYVQGTGQDLFDGNQIGFDEQVLVDYWNFWEELRADGVTTTPQQSSEEPDQTEQRYVAQGRVMVDNLPGNALTPAQTTLDGLAPGQQLTSVAAPWGEAGQGNALFTSGFSIPANCDNAATAAAFIDFWINNDEAGQAFASDNGAATNSRHLDQQLEDPELPDEKQHELGLYQEIVEREPVSIVYPPGYQANFEDTFTRHWDSVAFGEASVEEAAHAFYEEVNAALAAESTE